jgi:hypothetical protein
MHTHTYIYNAEEEVEMKFSCIECKKELNCKYIYIYVLYVDGGRAMVTVSI